MAKAASVYRFVVSSSSPADREYTRASAVEITRLRFFPGIVLAQYSVELLYTNTVIGVLTTISRVSFRRLLLPSVFILLVAFRGWSRADGVVPDCPDPRKHDEVDDGHQRADLRTVAEVLHPAGGQLLEPRVRKSRCAQKKNTAVPSGTPFFFFL